ncbi:Retrovirus-related Pol polyprotein from transposon [Trichinella papuae]|uniref:Retrovirus-related Pol polyprotein from transposon n=1 Tax=Trichinella papuae TaxID=268474 RepID=A0A0V1NAF2_9BILA|nr:Retrovirus-related Pol polyprotein from transposon [Trichinella papuae]
MALADGMSVCIRHVENQPHIFPDTGISRLRTNRGWFRGCSDGSERMVSYASRSLTKVERGYCATRREMRGLVWVTREFRPYICGVHFLVKTDHNRLRRLQNFKEPEGQVSQWLEDLYSTALDGHMEMRAHSPDKDADNAEEERRSSNPL